MSAIDDHKRFTEQLKRADTHFFTSWHKELEIANALKIAQKDENYEDEATGLEKLGDVYAYRGFGQAYYTTFARLDSLILAAALYNSSFVRKTKEGEKEQLKAKLRGLEGEIIKQCGGTINNGKHDIDSDHKKKLDDFRDTCREKLNFVQSKYTVFSTPLDDSDIAGIDSEENRASEIEALFLEIQIFVKQFVSGLLDECVEVLGTAPVSYAFVAFGSFPRKEVTPFSDLESAILIEEGMSDIPGVKEYFVRLTEYFNFKVLNLQETILPCMSIASLNDLNNEKSSLESLHKCTATACYKESNVDPIPPQEETGDPPLEEDHDWFYDDQMRGFSVDGRMSKACKTPLGRLVQGRGQSEDLIMTATEMAELYVKSLKYDGVGSHKRTENDYNLSTVLGNVSFLYGEHDLVDIYDGIVMSMTEATDGDTKLNPRQASAIFGLRGALDEFQFSLNASDIGLISSIKKKLYRVVDLVLVNLGKLQYPGVVDNSPWEILKRLRKDEKISSKACHNLLVVTGIVNEVRLMAYLRSGKQDELFSFIDQSMDIDYDLTKNLFLRFFYTVFPFQKAVSRFLESNSIENIWFPGDEEFYEYEPLTSAVAISHTSYRFLHEAMKKFLEAFEKAEKEYDPNTRRLCLAFLSCLHPVYSVQFCDGLRASTLSHEDDKSSDWRIFSFLVAALASFHQDDNVEGNVERFLAAATRESSRIPLSGSSRQGELPSRAQVVVKSYEILVHGLLKMRQKHYVEALRDFDRVMHERNTQSKKWNSSTEKLSMLEIFCVFMSGRCHMQLGHYQDSSIERSMRIAKVYTGNGEYMRILYHAYVSMYSLQQGDQDAVMKNGEKILTLFLRFQCPKGQDLWASIPAQGAVLIALFLGLLNREMGRVDEALRIFQLGSTRLISKALEFCKENCHVGEKSFETAKMYVEALRAVFNLLEAECLHEKGQDQEMWTKLTEAVSQLAKYRGKFEAIEPREIFSAVIPSTRQGINEVWRELDSERLAPRVVDAFTMHPLLAAWCDKVTMVMQFVLYTVEQNVYNQLVDNGVPLISMFSSNPSQVSQFQANPCEILKNVIPVLSHFPDARALVGGIFASSNAQRTAMLTQIRTSVAEIDRYAVEFTDSWIEVLLLYLRLSLCHDLVNAFGFFK